MQIKSSDLQSLKTTFSPDSLFNDPVRKSLQLYNLFSLAADEVFSLKQSLQSTIKFAKS